jgi:hypothetical protein
MWGRAWGVCSGRGKENEVEVRVICGGIMNVEGGGRSEEEKRGERKGCGVVQ